MARAFTARSARFSTSADARTTASSAKACGKRSWIVRASATRPSVPSSLETYADCPQKFFLGGVLGFRACRGAGGASSPCRRRTRARSFTRVLERFLDEEPRPGLSCTARTSSGDSSDIFEEELPAREDRRPDRLSAVLWRYAKAEIREDLERWLEQRAPATRRSPPCRTAPTRSCSAARGQSASDDGLSQDDPFVIDAGRRRTARQRAHRPPRLERRPDRVPGHRLQDRRAPKEDDAGRSEAARRCSSRSTFWRRPQLSAIPIGESRPSTSTPRARASSSASASPATRPGEPPRGPRRACSASSTPGRAAASSRWPRGAPMRLVRLRQRLSDKRGKHRWPQARRPARRRASTAREGDRVSIDFVPVRPGRARADPHLPRRQPARRGRRRNRQDDVLVARIVEILRTGTRPSTTSSSSPSPRRPRPSWPRASARSSRTRSRRRRTPSRRTRLDRRACRASTARASRRSTLRGQPAARAPGRVAGSTRDSRSSTTSTPASRSTRLQDVARRACMKRRPRRGRACAERRLRARTSIRETAGR